jgi:integrase
MANIQERKSKDGKVSYKVLVRLKGFPTQTATFERKTDAKKWAQNTESAIREGRHFKTTESKKHTLGDMIDRYLRDVLPKKSAIMIKQEFQLKWWKDQIGAYLLADITPALISEYRDKLMQTPVERFKDKKYHKKRNTPNDQEADKIFKPRSSASVNRYLSALSHAFSVAVKEWGWIDDSPMRKINKLRENNCVVRYLSDDERVRLLKACRESKNQYIYTVVVLALSTGARKMEIMGLTWKDVDLKMRVIRLMETKNKEPRAVPLQNHAYDLVKEMSKVRRLDTDLLFPGDNPKSPAELRKPWEEALAQANVTKFRFHDLRHSAASYLAMNGATLAEIAEVLGHKTLQMVKRYAHLSEQHTSKVVARMNEKIFGDI